MDSERCIARYRNLYAKLLRLYPKSFRERFGEGMSQTFNDLCRERLKVGNALFPFAIRTFMETAAGIMGERMTSARFRAKSLVRIALVTVFILLLPAVAMLFTDEVAWSLSDFLVAGTLLFSTGLAYALAATRAGNTAERAAIGLAVVTALLLVWVNLAVGLIGSENNPANLLYIGVLAVGFGGALIARLRSPGMARVLFTTAVAQALVPVAALLIWTPPVGTGAFVITLGANALFVMLFAGSALLFRRAGGGDRATDAGH